jgi:hypothetical protein
MADGKLKLYWFHDLDGPEEEGKYFSRQGHRISVTDANVQLVRQMLRACARDVLFEAVRVDGYYDLSRILGTK